MINKYLHTATPFKAQKQKTSVENTIIEIEMFKVIIYTALSCIK